MPKIKSTEKTVEQLEEDLRKTREELAIQEWGIEKTLWGMKVLVKELIQKEKELEKFKLATDNASDQIIITDSEATVLYINNATEKITGYATEEVVGKKAGKLWGNLMERSFYENLWKTIKVDKKTFVGEITNQRKNNQPYTAHISISPILDEKGEIEFFVGIAHDITKEKEIDTAKTEFVSLASHQLRTPLTTISWYTEMILKGDVGKVIPDQMKYLEEIYTGNHRMIELVNTLLDVSRLELGTFKVEPKPTDVIALAQSVFDEQEPSILKKKLVVTKDFSKDVPTFSTDPKLLRMVFQNLLANAVEYTPEGGSIEFGISLGKKKQILIQVSDTGYGIPKHQQDKIFTKFFRADNVRDKDTDGTGLGLYIVKSIVENAGGKIWFSSPGGSALGGESSENPGTTFYVTLPLDGAKREENTQHL